MKFIRIEVDEIDLRFRYRDEWRSDDFSSIRICPWCQRPWCKITMQHPYFMPVGASCDHCPPWRPKDPYQSIRVHVPPVDVPGSLFDSNQFTVDRTYSLIDYLPQPLLAREVLIHLSALQKGIIAVLTPEDLNSLQLYRERILSGEMMSAEDTKRAIALLRADRVNAAMRATASRSKSKAKTVKAPPQNPMDLLAKLGIKPGAAK